MIFAIHAPAVERVARRLFVRPKAGQPPWPDSLLGWAAHLLLMTYYIGTVGVGVLGFYQPSRTLEAELMPGLVYVWSSIFIVFGGASLIGRYLQEWRVEAVGIIVQALALAVWGYALLEGADTALQIGARQSIAGFFFLGVALLAVDWTNGQKRNAEIRRREEQSRIREQAVTESLLRAREAMQKRLDEDD